MEDDKIIEAIERIRRDQYQPGRYIFFTFLNGVAQGLGMALGMTLILGVVVYIVSVILTRFVNFPIIGYYIAELIQIVNQSLKHGVPIR